MSVWSGKLNTFAICSGLGIFKSRENCLSSTVRFSLIQKIRFLCLCAGDNCRWRNYVFLLSVSTSIPLPWKRYLRNTSREFLLFGTNVYLDWGMNWLDFGGHRPKFKGYLHSFGHNSRIHMLIDNISHKCCTIRWCSKVNFSVSS